MSNDNKQNIHCNKCMRSLYHPPYCNCKHPFEPLNLIGCTCAGRRDNVRDQEIPIWSRHWHNPITESQGSRCCNRCYPNLTQDPTSYAPSYTQRHNTSNPASNLTSNTPSYIVSYQPVNESLNMSYPAADMASYLASPMRASSVLYPTVDLETNLAHNRASYSMYPTSRLTQRASDLGSTRHRLRARHISLYVNPYTIPARNEYPRNAVMRVPATHACQQNGGSNLRCPISCNQSRQTITCLYASGIRDEPLHITYNWLVSLFERYRGFRDLHITTRNIGAVISFDTYYNATLARCALDGVWINCWYQLKVEFINPQIYPYIHCADFTPEHFRQTF